jgi:hypothetical protein
MNDQTTKLLESLALKLGTTAEYLWGALIKQAHVSVISNLLLIVFTIVMGIILLRAHKWASSEYDGYVRYNDDNGVFLTSGMIVFLLIWVGFVIGSIISVDEIITALFNPEYWALKQILGSVQ